MQENVYVDPQRYHIISYVIKRIRCIVTPSVINCFGSPYTSERNRHGTRRKRFVASFINQTHHGFSLRYEMAKQNRNICSYAGTGGRIGMFNSHGNLFLQ